MKSNRLKITGIIIPGVILAIMMQSCGVAKQYTSPKIETEKLIRYDASMDTLTIADIPWQEYFTDSLLRQLIVEGLEQNLDLQILLQSFDY